MRFDSVSCSYNGKTFELGKWSGSLRIVPNSGVSSITSNRGRPAKVEEALRLCHNPYRLGLSRAREASSTMDRVAQKGLKTAQRLVQLSRRNFTLARLYAGASCPLFTNAKEAIEFFREGHVGDQSQLCLARALFAAKTSRRFRDEGVVMIGVFLPARALHAWVIEGGEIADQYDDIWINYQPVAILSCSKVTRRALSY